MAGAQRFLASAWACHSPAARPTHQMSTPGPTLELLQATRRFDALVAVDQLSLQVAPGEIHALVGENGAGKSTALKMLSGHLAPSSGEVHVDGAALSPHQATRAMALGVGMVFQHFMLVDAFTALENVMLGAEPVRGFGFLDRRAARKHAEKVAAAAGLAIDLSRTTSSLSVGERQRLEILRVMVRGARAILLDEPTAVLSPIEVHELYAMLRSLAADGATVLVVTHRLDEVTRYCDRVTVMRRGKRVQSQTLSPVEQGGDDDHEEKRALARAIMGGEVPDGHEPAPAHTGEVVMELTATSAEDDHSTGAIDVSLSLCRGEVVGVAAVEGNGQVALARCLAGLGSLQTGSLKVAGKTVLSAGDRDSPHTRVAKLNAHGVQVVHADRHRYEMLSDASVADNLVLGDLGRVDEQVAVSRRLSRFQVYPAEPQRQAAELSGGNQQKVVMARVLDRKLTVLVAAQPTRGVDVGTAHVIQRALSATAENGAAVLLISADLNELRALSHRIVVLRKGKLVAEFTTDASDEEIGHAMLGTEGK